MSDDLVDVGRSRAAPVRRHDTFAVLRRARAAVHRADVALDIARETLMQTKQVRSRDRLPPDLDDATRLALHLMLDRIPDEA
jgi:hypothetical protein